MCQRNATALGINASAVDISPARAPHVNDEVLILRADGGKYDIGYCRSVVRSDGRIVTVYYYNTEERPENHIAATIWSPPAE